jgi:tetratricopeptide (TPR) repeat protein
MFTPTAIFWFYYVIPVYQINNQLFFIITTVLIMVPTIFWFFHSGRVLLPSSKFTVVYCLKPQDTLSAKHIQNSMYIFNRELETLGLLEKFRLISIGEDIIKNQKKAHTYRERYNVDLIIWGQILSGSREEKEVCDFKGLFFTYKIPGAVVAANLINIFKTDINIALVNRDWNVYEINSLPDTEKISGHLSEIVMFIVGIIYCQEREFAKDSILILEQLFELLNRQTVGERVAIDSEKNTLQLSPQMLRKGRILEILLNVYKNLGVYLVESRDYQNGNFYLRKFYNYRKRDIGVLSSLALCAFYLNDLAAAKKYTDEIVDKKNQIYLFNQAFFGIYDKNYASALHYYKETLKIKHEVTTDIATKVIAFLDERKSEYPNELAYDFAIGFINYYFCQKDMGNQELRKFVKRAKKRPQYHEIRCFIENNIFPKDKRKKR